MRQQISILNASCCWEVFEVERPEVLRGYLVQSSVRYCPDCRRIWATIECGGFSEAHTVNCELCARYCHPDLLPVPGSILDTPRLSDGFDDGLLKVLPERLLEREYQLHIKAALNGNFDNLSLEPPIEPTFGSKRPDRGPDRDGEDLLNRNPS